MKLLVLMIIGIMFLIQDVNSASFDCKNTSTAIEEKICNNPTLSTLDEKLSLVYKNAKSSAIDSEVLKRNQINWIKETRKCKDDESCIEESYKHRIDELSTALQVDFIKNKQEDSPKSTAIDRNNIEGSEREIISNLATEDLTQKITTGIPVSVGNEISLQDSNKHYYVENLYLNLSIFLFFAFISFFLLKKRMKLFMKLAFSSIELMRVCFYFSKDKLLTSLRPMQLKVGSGFLFLFFVLYLTHSSSPTINGIVPAKIYAISTCYTKLSWKPGSVQNNLAFDSSVNIIQAAAHSSSTVWLDVVQRYHNNGGYGSCNLENRVMFLRLENPILITESAGKKYYVMDISTETNWVFISYFR